ncbi:LacI family DNA-binding transcriptional regulator [Agreia pratensis]|uniref:Transcriptional regulator, LacI family n=1 Tax=Agreia pratensis TaxID=150121 RepID=A0A1X7JBW0_9MICO|nr:LacI family DNA-binding transcriptional regulator [Agreia pratensis]SMG25034.1 transcriptional regulator, LacI family [Agreia pratensis]
MTTDIPRVERAVREVSTAPAVATLEAVAALAGVSKSTASRVINGSPRVTEQAITRVNAAIAQLHYVPNRAARNLVRRRTQMIAMVIPERTAAFFADPYFAEVIQGAAMYASTTDYTLTLLIESEADAEKTHRFLQSGSVDGALLLSHHSSSATYLELSRSLPVVFGVRPVDDLEFEAHTVDVDNVAAAAIATQHLVDRGRTRIATITGPLAATAARDRLAGWRSTLEAAGLASGSASESALELVEEGDYTPASGAAAVERLLARGLPFDGLFVASAQMASGALSVLREHGLSVPGDVAISTIDNNSFSTDTKPQLTTVDLHTSEKGAEMVKALLQLIAGEAVERETWIPIELVQRDSA